VSGVVISAGILVLYPGVGGPAFVPVRREGRGANRSGRDQCRLLQSIHGGSPSNGHFVACRVGVTVLAGAVGEIENVSQAFLPAGRFSAANSP